VHDGSDRAVGQRARGGRGIVQPGGLLDRESVGVRAERDDGTLTVLDDGDDAGAADAHRLEAVRPQMRGDRLRGAVLLHGQFRGGVELAVEPDERVEALLEARGDLGGKTHEVPFVWRRGSCTRTKRTRADTSRARITAEALRAVCETL